MSIGKIVQIIGPIIDIKFSPEHIPEIRNAIEIKHSLNNVERTIIGEVAMQMEGNVVRCVSMSPTEGLPRGIDAAAGATWSPEIR